MIELVAFFVIFFLELILLIVIPPITLISRFCKKRIDVGLGPDPLINNIYLSQALKRAGFSAETYVTAENYITSDYDKIFCKQHMRKQRVCKLLLFIWQSVGVYIYTIFSYKCIYIYFDGAPLSSAMNLQKWHLLSRLEPYFYKLANVKVVTMTFGGDVYNFDACPLLYYRYLMRREYPRHYRYYQQKRTKSNIVRWCEHADCVVNGGDNLYYIPFCGDVIRANYLCIDTLEYKEALPEYDGDKLVITHVVNHRDIKGSRFFEEAIEELQAEGLNIEFINLFQVPGEVARKALEDAHIVADQLICGAYGFTAIQSMAMGKPVMTYFDPRLEEMLVVGGVLEKGELPLVNCTPFSVKEAIRELYYDRDKLVEIGHRSRRYAEKYHSIEAGVALVKEINKKIGLEVDLNV